MFLSLNYSKHLRRFSVVLVGVGGSWCFRSWEFRHSRPLLAHFTKFAFHGHEDTGLSLLCMGVRGVGGVSGVSISTSDMSMCSTSSDSGDGHCSYHVKFSFEVKSNELVIFYQASKHNNA